VRFLVVGFADSDDEGTRAECETEEEVGEAVKRALHAGAVYVHVDNIQALNRVS
jgi:hypothetical protein